MKPLNATNNSHFFLSVLLSCLAFLCGLTKSYAYEQPNIVIIVCDDLNDSIEGMGGHSQAKTPNIDRLIKSGVSFTNAASNAPICGPSRASIWSGLHPISTGIYGGNQHKNRWYQNEVLKTKETLFETFINQGYYNFATGKIHHNGHQQLDIFQNKDGSSGWGSYPNFGPLPNDGKPENKRQGIMPPWWEANERVGGWGDGFGPLQDLSSYGEGYGWTMFYNGQPWQYREGHNRDLMPDEIHAKEAVEFLSVKRDQPFILTIGFSRPHSPWYAPREYFDMFPIETIELAPYLENDLDDCARILAEDRDLAEPWGWHKYSKIMNNGGVKKFRRWTQAYLACVAFVDAQVGKVLDAIEAREDAENTLIIFTSDHGYHMGEKDYIFKLTPWEESVRVPLVIAGPKVAKGKQSHAPVSLIDIFPTCLDYASLGANHSLDGHSLKPLLSNPRKGRWGGPDFSLAACGSQVKTELHQPALVKNQHFSIRTEQYRYIRCRNGEEELYDHFSDPNEWNNLSDSKAHASIIKGMRIRLNKALENAIN